jgi:hypothetical protein
MPRKIREQNTGFSSDNTSLEIPRGTTAERPASGDSGSLRFNTTLGALEQWTGNAWDPIYPTPQIYTVTSSTGGLNEDDNSTVTITGASLSSVDTVVYKNHLNGNTIATAGSVTIVSDTEINFPYDHTAGFSAGQQISIQVSSTVSGKSAIAAAVFTISADPVWQTSSGSLGTVSDGSRSGYSVSVLATAPDSVAIQYELSQGSLPAGASLSINGTISGNLTSVGSSTTSSFHIMAVAQTIDSTVRRTERQFSITVSPPTITFSPSSGSLGTLANFNRSAAGLTAVSASVTSGSISSVAITSGAAPTGLTLNSNGTWSGTANAETSDTTYNFTVTATATGDYGTVTSTASFSITVQRPAATTFTSSGTFTVPVGLTSVDVLVIAGGGSGGAAGGGIQHEKGGGGGAGGFIYRPAFPISPGTPISVTVGDGGGPQSHSPWGTGSNGSNSSFSNLTAIGGGGGQSTGGSGGGARGNGGGGGGGNQPGQPGDSGTYGFGNPGGPSSGHQSGGGGGAGGGGSTPNAGAGRSSTITGSTVFYSGGGGGYGGSGGQGGGGSYNGQSGTGNTGGGGSGGHETPSGAGGKGVVIVAY